jgi:hypothetical protein
MTAPCTNGTDTAVCNDLPPPAGDDTDGRSCSCENDGFSYVNDTHGCMGK